MVAVLCCSKRSVYKSFEGVDCYDIDRDARTFTGGFPVVAHPPCRSWSAYCAHQAKPLPREKELAPMCVLWLMRCGGVLEHPAHSRLWDAMELPKPGERKYGLHCVAVQQCWWGDSRTKNTWLLFSRVDLSKVNFPPKRETNGDRRTWQLMSKEQRSATHPEFARWLVEVARQVS